MAVQATPPYKTGHAYARARSQARFLACFEECGQVVDACRWAKVPRSEHYRWLEEDPTYRPRFQAARAKATQSLEDEAVRRARYGVRRVMLYKGKPVSYQGQLVYEHEYSDSLMIKLLEAGDPDRFNRQRVAPLEGNLDNLTEGQIRGLLEWLQKQIQVADEIIDSRTAYAELQPAEPATKPKK